MNANPIDVPRLIRIATLLFAVLGGTLVYFTYEPEVQAAQVRLDDDETSLRSDDVALSEMPRLRAERVMLARRYDTSFTKSPDAVFLRELASTVSRHSVELVSTNVSDEAAPVASVATNHPSLFTKTEVRLSMRGSYGHLLAAIRDLSTGTAIVDVADPTLRREGGGVVADVPVTIFEPAESRAVAPVTP